MQCSPAGLCEVAQKHRQTRRAYLDAEVRPVTPQNQVDTKGMSINRTPPSPDPYLFLNIPQKIRATELT